MKKEVIVLFLLGILLVSPLVLAQEQVQTYSGFNRFVDNVKMFFSSGDKKVMLALEIREREINSAIMTNKNGEDKKMNKKIDKNLEGAWKKLQIVQDKVSVNVAEEVMKSSDEIKNKIDNEENLPDDFELYVLEEEKTGLKAEWVIAVDGEEGQTMTHEIEGERNMEQNKIREIEKRIDDIDIEIKEWVVDNFEKDVDEDGLTQEVATKIVEENGDDGLTRDIKTYVDGGGSNDVDNDMAPGPQGIVGDAGDGDNGMAPGTSTSAPGDILDSDDGVDETPPTEPDKVIGGGVAEPGDGGSSSSDSDGRGVSRGDSGGDGGGDSTPVT